MVDNVELVEIRDREICCGSAGTYNIDQPEIAAELGKRKANNIIETDCQIVAMGNIGCMVQIQNHLQELKSDLRVKHTFEILEDALVGSND